MWPLQRDMDEFYGDPRNGDVANPIWMKENLVKISPPFQMFYAGKLVKQLTVHKKCAASLMLVFLNIWDEADQIQDVIDAWGVSTYGGIFNYRLKRGQSTLSTHAYAAAIDLDPARNAHHSAKFSFSPNGPVVRAFEEEGWVWGGRWKGRDVDAMHFQAARLK